MSKFHCDSVDRLFKTILNLKTIEECYDYFEDICTINEIHAIAQRLQVAKLLSEKKTYSEIESITSASTATISRVNRSLNYGNDGYDLVFDRINK